VSGNGGDVGGAAGLFGCGSKVCQWYHHHHHHGKFGIEPRSATVCRCCRPKNRNHNQHRCHVFPNSTSFLCRCGIFKKKTLLFIGSIARNLGFSGTHSASSLRDMARLCLGSKLTRKNRSLDCLVEEESDLATENSENDRESETSNEVIKEFNESFQDFFLWFIEMLFILLRFFSCEIMWI